MEHSEDGIHNSLHELYHLEFLVKVNLNLEFLLQAVPLHLI